MGALKDMLRVAGFYGGKPALKAKYATKDFERAAKSLDVLEAQVRHLENSPNIPPDSSVLKAARADRANAERRWAETGCRAEQRLNELKSGTHHFSKWHDKFMRAAS